MANISEINLVYENEDYSKINSKMLDFEKVKMRNRSILSHNASYMGLLAGKEDKSQINDITSADITQNDIKLK
jgi:hypothetical protein